MFGDVVGFTPPVVEKDQRCRLTLTRDLQDQHETLPRVGTTAVPRHIPVHVLSAALCRLAEGEPRRKVRCNLEIF